MDRRFEKSPTQDSMRGISGLISQSTTDHPLCQRLSTGVGRLADLTATCRGSRAISS
jgi:hypothetical protein